MELVDDGQKPCFAFRFIMCELTEDFKESA